MTLRRLCAVALAVLLPAVSFAQGGGASTTGTILGRVTDSSELVLPGVTVTATSPSMIGPQTQVTGENGTFRFPAVPPGVYTLTFELAGFNGFRREGIQVALGFNATVNAQLAVASLQETVTVTGASPVIDTSATSVQQNFKAEQLNSIPNGRDMWALLAATPGVVMSRIDVGGNRAGNQTGYTAYGLTGQVRVSVEGINTTEGTGGAGFYFDYGSFEEVFLGVAGQGAEAATPGVQSQFLGKSGGNRFAGEFYQDYYNNGFQASNLSDAQLAAGLRPGSNEVDSYRDMNLNFGGPIKKDKAWFHTSWRKQFNAVENSQFDFEKTFDTWNTNPSVKATYQLTQNHKLVGYYQWNMKTQPNRLPLGTYFYDNEGQTVRQESPSWVYKGEWNGTISDKLYLEARFGDFGYYDPRRTNSDEQYFWRDSGTLRLTGAHAQSQTDRDRKQLTGAATYFLDTKKGSHTIKFGGEIYKESQWSGRQQNVGGNIEHIYANGRSSQVVFGVPTALSVSGRRASDDGDLLVVNKLDQQDLFLNDTWALGRLTLTMGARWDRYKGWMPENRQLAYSIGPVSVPAQVFPERDFFTWNSFGPRVGMTYDLAGDGKTVVKASYGLFWHNPGPTVSADANPNQNNKSVTYNWNDVNGDRRYQVGEEVGAPTNTTLAGTIQIDPDLQAALLARRLGLPRAPARRQHRLAPRLRLQDGRRPHLALQPEPADLGLHRALPVCRHRRGRRRQHRRRPHAHPLRRAGGAGRQLPDQQRGAEHAALLALQDGGSVDGQAPGRALVGAGRRQLHVAERLPGPVPERPQRAVCRTDHPLGLQGVGQRRHAVRHPPLAAAAPPGGPELRPPDLGGLGGGHRGRRHLREHDRQPVCGRTARCAAPGQHHRARPSRRSRLHPLPQPAGAADRRPVQHHQQQRGRNPHGHDRLRVQPADGGTGAAHGPHRRPRHLLVALPCRPGPAADAAVRAALSFPAGCPRSACLVERSPCPPSRQPACATRSPSSTSTRDSNQPPTTKNAIMPRTADRDEPVSTPLTVKTSGPRMVAKRSTTA